jgi:PadR family transcriptional regulator PadR
LELAVLTAISGGRVYAGELIDRLADTPFAAQEGTLYPLLGKLRRDGLLDYEWVESDAGPPRKYYSLTADGRAHLEQLDAYWRSLNSTLTDLGAPR